MLLKIKNNISISDIENLKNNYHCIYNDISFNLTCYYDEDKFKMSYNLLDDISYSLEIQNRKENNIDRKNILLWLVNSCDYLSSKKIDDYSELDKILMLIVYETNELFISLKIFKGF